MEYNPHSQHWLLLDRVVQQLVLQQAAAGSRAASEQGSLKDDASESNKVHITKIASVTLPEIQEDIRNTIDGAVTYLPSDIIKIK